MPPNASAVLEQLLQRRLRPSGFGGVGPGCQPRRWRTQCRRRRDRRVEDVDGRRQLRLRALLVLRLEGAVSEDAADQQQDRNGGQADGPAVLGQQELAADDGVGGFVVLEMIAFGFVHGIVRPAGTPREGRW